METIYTIPVNEAFRASADDAMATCPFCRLEAKLEEDETERILGAAMMEPDVRIETNEKGFCNRHFARMFHKKNRLGLALMLESHLTEVEKRVDGKGVGAIRGGAAAESVRQLSRLRSSCYICDRVDLHLGHMTETALYLYESDPTFRRLVEAQKCFCLPHYEKMLETAAHAMSKRGYADFSSTVHTIEANAVKTLENDVSWFCKKFDYRYENEPWNNAKDAVERTIRLLGGEKDADRL